MNIPFASANETVSNKLKISIVFDQISIPHNIIPKDLKL